MIDRRPSISGFHRYAVEEALLEALTRRAVRRRRLDYESHAIGLSRNEVGSLLVAAGLGAPNEHALISLLAINGLRALEALGANIDALGLERGHRAHRAAQGRQDRHHPLAPRPSHRPGRSTSRSANDRTDRSSYDQTASRCTATAPAGSCAASRVAPGRQADRTAYPASRVHHRRP